MKGKHFLFVCCALLPSPALGDVQHPPEAWDVTLGIGGVMRPTFEGSNRYIGSPLPVISVRWRDTISFGEEGLSAYWHHRNLRIGAGLTFEAGRSDHSTSGIFSSGDDRLAGLGNIDRALGVRGFISYRLGFLNLNAAATKFTARQDHGILVDLGASVPVPVTKRLVITPHLRATWADDNYIQTFFGVTPSQAAASIFPAFSASSGFKNVNAGVNVVYNLNRHWVVGGDASVKRLMGDAAKSPISISNTNVLLMTMIGYHF